jgi:hypothetical protein
MTQAWEGLACSRGAAEAKILDLSVEGGRIASAVAGEEYADWNPVGHPRPSRQVAKSASLGPRKVLREDWAGIIRVAMPASGLGEPATHPTD